MAQSNAVIRSSSHIKEDKSKRSFEDIINPWFVSSWTSKDYGIDAMVELTSKMRDTSDLRVDSKYLLVQLKASDKLKLNKEEILFQLPVKKINQWMSSNVPVMFVIFDNTSNRFYYLWINEILLHALNRNSPLWITQKTVTLKIPLKNELNSLALDVIRQYVLDFKQSNNIVITPGRFFELKNSCSLLLSKFEDYAGKFNFSSITSSLKTLSKDLDLSIYRLAITGLSRVGKSSLINSLLKKQVSPTGFFQTTGVPIQIIPGKEEYVEIIYLNGEKQKRQFSFETINDFASQDLNENNVKQVKMLIVSVLNQELQKGISIFDIPGLDDPDDSVVGFTVSTLNYVNAIFYVIDASPAQHGGFIFKSDYKKHILSFGQSLDKIFLVFNKSDVLSEENLELLKERVTRDLKKLDLYDRVSDKIYYITTIPNAKKSLDSIQKLENDLWKFVVNNNKHGIARLGFINKEIFESVQSFSDILNSRLISVGKRDELQKAIGVIEHRIPEVRKMLKYEVGLYKKSLVTSLNWHKNEILVQLENWLMSFKIEDNLPDHREIKNYLILNLTKCVNSINNEYAFAMNRLKNSVDKWIEENIKQVRSILSAGGHQRLIDISEIEKFEFPEIDLASAWGMGFLGYVVGFAINPPIAFAVGVIGFLGNIIMSAESSRAKRILKITGESRKRYDVTFTRALKTYDELLVEQTSTLNTYFENKLNNYLNDLSTQINKLDNPLTLIELNLYNQTIKELQELKNDLLAFENELKVLRN